MKKLIAFILLSIGILSFGSFSVYAEDVTYTFDEEQYQIIPIDLSGTDWILNTIVDTDSEEPSDEPFLTNNQIMKLVTTLVIYIVALFVGMLAKSKLLIAMTGLLWLIPLVTIDNFIIRIFCIIMLIISLMILLKERDDYYD
jgi:hypothetical protein